MALTRLEASRQAFRRMRDIGATIGQRRGKRFRKREARAAEIAEQAEADFARRQKEYRREQKRAKSAPLISRPTQFATALSGFGAPGVAIGAGVGGLFGIAETWAQGGDVSNYAAAMDYAGGNIPTAIGGIAQNIQAQNAMTEKRERYNRLLALYERSLKPEQPQGYIGGRKQQRWQDRLDYPRMFDVSVGNVQKRG